MRQIRLASTLSFDEITEADIIGMVEQLNQQHRMGDFLSSLFRLAVDNPDLLVRNQETGKYTEGAVVMAVEQIGKTKVRADYIKRALDQIDVLNKKIDAIYDMCVKTQATLEFGKRNGLENEIVNNAIAAYALQRNIKKINEIVGEKLDFSALTFNKQEKIKADAEEVLDCIIKTYEPVISELLKLNAETGKIQEVKVVVEQQQVPVMNTQYVPVQMPIQNTQVPIQNTVQIPTQTNLDLANTQPIQSKVEEPKKDNIGTVNTNNTEDIVIDFGDADFSALENFFGE